MCEFVRGECVLIILTVSGRFRSQGLPNLYVEIASRWKPHRLLGRNRLKGKTACRWKPDRL